MLTVRYGDLKTNTVTCTLKGAKVHCNSRVTAVQTRAAWKPTISNDSF